MQITYESLQFSSMIFTFDIYHVSIISRRLTCFMNKTQTTILLVFVILVSSIGFTYASAQMPDPKTVPKIVSSPVSVFGKTYSLQVDNKTYNIYYGFKFTYANAENISLVSDHNSMQINLNGITETDSMWIQFPQDLVSAENNNFILYVDGHEKKYELATSDHSTIMGFTVPTNTTRVEIQGTHVIPEFPTSATVAMMIGFIIVILRIR
jgi:hypothetical protein